VLTTRTGSYRVGPLVTSGDIADLYAVDGDRALLKLPRRPADNDLMAAEVRALTALHTEGDPRHRAYAPRLMDSFTHADGGGARRTATVLERLTGFVPLTAIGRRIDPRDAAWMWRRLLVALGWAHRAGVVHGAVLPRHVLIHPAEHGVALVDWCYAVAPGERIAALVAADRDSYPPEVAARAAASAATDIFMATRTMIGLIDDVPAPMRRFADGCCYAAPRMRPQDAWRLLAEFDELLENLYGPRTFRPFHL
jgi:aminoglycoside phosphotransferase (APT) family kinase protein